MTKAPTTAIISASTLVGEEPTGHWLMAEGAEIDRHAHYLVKTNAGEWRDPDLRVMKGYEVEQKRQVGYIRGRPVLIARINDPGAILNR